MVPMEIALLVIGVIIFVISFLIPDRAPEKSIKDKDKDKEEIRRMMGKELDGMKLRINEATNDTVEYAMEKLKDSDYDKELNLDDRFYETRELIELFANKEIINYEHEVDSNGEVIADYPDGNDHWIDSLRYATSPLSMRRGNSA